MVKLVDVARRRRCRWRRCPGHSTTTRRSTRELAARVRAAAPKLGYRPNHLARNLRRQRTNLWLLIISDIENAFFTSVARGVEDAAVANEFSVVLCNADEDEDKEARYVELAVAEQAAGVIVSPHSIADRHHAADAGEHPGRRHRPRARRTRRLGHRATPAAARPTPPSTSSPRAGRARAASPAHVRRRPRSCAVSATKTPCAPPRSGRRPSSTCRSRSTAAAPRRSRCSTSARPPDSLFVANAALGLGVLQELRARDLRPGRDLGLICFDDAPWAPFIDPPISVVSQPAYRMGAQAAALLVERIGGAGHSARRIVLGTDLIVRDSSRKQKRAKGTR